MSLLLWACLAAMASSQTWAAPRAAETEFAAFFPFCIDWHDSQKRDFAQQAQMLKELDYPGVGHIWPEKIQERLAALDAADLKLYQVTITVNIAPDKPAYAPAVKEMLPLLKGHNVQILLLMNGLKPSDEAGDPRAIDIIKELSALGKESGVQWLLYPHTDFWMERIEDCMRVADKVDQPDVGVMFNLCHWLRVSKDRDYESRLRQAMPRLRAVSVNGADERDPNPGWARYIQPLGRGSFDTFKLLKTLRALGYSGPVGLQCYGIGGDTRDHLAESMKTWKTYQARLSGKN